MTVEVCFVPVLFLCFRQVAWQSLNDFVFGYILKYVIWKKSRREQGQRCGKWSRAAKREKFTASQLHRCQQTIYHEHFFRKREATKNEIDCIISDNSKHWSKMLQY